MIVVLGHTIKICSHLILGSLLVFSSFSMKVISIVLQHDHYVDPFPTSRIVPCELPRYRAATRASHTQNLVQVGHYAWILTIEYSVHYKYQNITIANNHLQYPLTSK